jgi:hypothetical protein
MVKKKFHYLQIGHASTNFSAENSSVWNPLLIHTNSDTTKWILVLNVHSFDSYMSPRVYALRLKFAFCAYPFCTNLLLFGSMHLQLAVNFLHFVQNLGVIYALGHSPNFYEIHL